ncbi:MAG: SufD family Fe-S cluster assembly protein, partial [Verrucomicrobia bacterium]|nr:SufD family Fe-S cluster assembly protein [Verrucomicrobiota bacterium]
LGTVIAELAKRGSLAAHSVALGARLSRQQLFPRLVGEEADCLLNGLYLTDGERTADHFMVVDHIAPRCESREHFNGVLLDRSRGVFHGRILVRPQAQKTDARQTNKNLLLSEEARAHTKPQLEIYADDVRCTHGATVGRLSAEALFYLRSRGIGPEDARRFLVHAFAGEILERIGPPAVRDRIHRLVWERLAAADLNAVSGALD